MIMHQKEYGRTMLEIISVMGIIGVLSMVGVYSYQQASNSLLADGIVKDVLLRASQIKSSDDSNMTGHTKKVVYTTEYKNKKEEYKTKGRYNFRYEIVDMYTNTADSAHSKLYTKIYESSSNKGQYVVVKTDPKGKSITRGVCEAIRGKLLAYGENLPKIICINRQKPEENNIAACIGNNVIKNGCPDDSSSELYFTVKYPY